MSRSKVMAFARQMRNSPTKAEKLMWEVLRKRKLYLLRFNRQFIFSHAFENSRTSFYIADFYCSEIQLIIELDGGYHDRKEQKIYDEIRTETLKLMGLRVIRFSNEAVIKNIDSVVLELKQFIKALDAGVKF